MASEYIEDSSGEEREGFRRGGGSRGRGGGGGRGGRGGGGRRGGGSRGRGRGSKGKSGGGRRGGGSRGRGKSSAGKSSAGKSSAGKSKGRSSARSASVKGAKSRSRSATRSASRSAQRSATKSQAASRAKSRAPSGRPSMKDITGPTKTKTKTKTKTNFKSKDKLRDASGMLTRAGVAANKAKKAATRAKAANVDKASYDKLKSLAKAKNITNEQLRSLKDMNVKMGLNPTTGMGVKQSFAYRGPQLTKDINNLKDLYGKLPTPGNIAMKALGMFGKKPAAPKTSVTGRPSMADIAGPNPNAPSGIGGLFSGLKDKFNMGPSMVTPDRRGGGSGINNKMISDMLLRPAVDPGGIGGQFKQPSPTVMPGMENLQQLEQKFGNDGIGNLLARAQQVPTTNYGYGASATAGRENLDRLTAAPSYMPLSSFMNAADGGRAGYSEGGSGTEQQQRENFYDFGYDDFLSLEQYMGSAQALRDLERNANGGRIGYQYGGTGAYPSGEVYGGNYAQGGQAQGGLPMHGGGYNQGGSPMVMMTGANSGLGNVLEHYKTIRGKM